MATNKNLTHEKLAEVLNQHYKLDDGVIDVRGALDELCRSYEQPVIEQAFLDFYAHSKLYDERMPQRALVSTFYGLVSFAEHRKLSAKGAECLTSIALRAGSIDADYLYYGILALERGKYTDNLRYILDECVLENVPDSTWIGVKIVSLVLTDEKEFDVFKTYVDILSPRIPREPDRMRRDGMTEILEKIKSR